jgi:flagellar biogenesis protein FliO
VPRCKASGSIAPPWPRSPRAPLRTRTALFRGSLVAVLLAASPAAAAGSEPRPRETVGDLLRAGGAAPAADAGSVLRSFLRLAGGAAAVLVAGVALLWFYRRLSPQRAIAARGGLLEVLDRAALTPRHTVYLLRIAERKMVLVGVSGERMAALAALDDASPRAAPPAERAGLDEALAPAAVKEWSP